MQVAGFVMREASPIASNWRADGTLRDYLVRNNIVAIAEIDTRKLTRVLRETGVMRGVIAAGNDLSPTALVDRARQAAKMEGADWVKAVTCKTPFDWTPSSVRRRRARRHRSRRLHPRARAPREARRRGRGR